MQLAHIKNIIDPSPMDAFSLQGWHHIKQPATIGMVELSTKILKQ